MDEKDERAPINLQRSTSRVPLLTTLGIGAAIATAFFYHSPFPFADNEPANPQFVTESDTLHSWLELERPIALQGILDNIGADGAQAAGALPGIVVASPSKSDPNYFYTWTRDSALTIKTLVDELATHGTPGIEPLVQDYIGAQAVLQGVENPSGGLCSDGLGEAKFNVDETAFTGDWGRPQRDGPALRAIAMISYARYLMSAAHNATVKSIIWPILQNDLSYVTQHWNESTFDLWEEVQGKSFFTTAMQYRSLVEGARLAQSIGEKCDHCISQAPQVLCFLQSYWTGSYALSNTESGRSGKDLNSILTSTHMFDAEADCDDKTFQPCSDKALANHKVVTDSFRSTYAINEGISVGVGVAVGRYSEDVYMGGNPWYLGAFAAAEMLYQAVYQWDRLGSLNITATSLGFFRDLYPSAALGTYPASSPEFGTILEAVMAYADSYMANAKRYTPVDGSLAEQYSRYDGTPLSARDLTWSYAAFVTAHNARNKALPPSWGASSVRHLLKAYPFPLDPLVLTVTPKAKLPSVCSSSSAQGPCSTATNTAWPSKTSAPPCTVPKLTTLMFNLRKETLPGQDVFLSGNVSQLGAWDTHKALPLSAGKYTPAKPLWYVFERFPVGAGFEYKYFVKSADGGAIDWEDGLNRQFDVPASCDVSVSVDDEWR